MKTQPSFWKMISQNVINWEIRRVGLRWLRIFNTVEDFLAHAPIGGPGAWRKGVVATVPEVSSPEEVDDMVTMHMTMDQLNPFSTPTVLVGYCSPAVDELVRCLFVGRTRPLFGAPGHSASSRTAVVMATGPPKTDAAVRTLGGSI